MLYNQLNILTQKLNLYLSTLLLGSLIIYGGGISTFAKSQKDIKLKRNLSNSQKVKKAIQNIDRLDPQKPTKKVLKLDDLGNHKDSLVNINSENSNIEITNKKGKVKFKIPLNLNAQNFEVLDNKIIYPGDKAQSTIELIDGGVRQVINIESKDASNFYEFPINLEDGQSISLNEDGSASVKNRSGDSIIFIVKPWARDNDNKELKTWYEITTTGIKQIIDFSDATFPVIADPTWCGDAINYVTWISRSGEWSASNKATWCGYWHCGGVWNCWQESYDKTPSHSAWNKQWNTNQYWSMYNQFMCHADIAKGAKWEWNLEPAKADKGYSGFVNSWCN